MQISQSIDVICRFLLTEIEFNGNSFIVIIISVGKFSWIYLNLNFVNVTELNHSLVDVGQMWHKVG